MGLFGRLFGKKDTLAPKEEAARTPKEEGTHAPIEEVNRLCRKAMAAIERDDSAAAIKDLTRAEALDPRDPWVQLLLHQAYGIAGDDDSAVRHFRALKKLDPATAAELLRGMPESLRAKMRG